MRFKLSLASLTIATLAITQPLSAQANRSAGIIPANADGRQLNLGFETGDLTDWKATGDAFARQPIKGDTVSPRRADMKSNHAGNYWIGTYEIAGDKPIGTLTSVPFKVTHPFGSFLVAGGPNRETRVEIVLAEGDKVIQSTIGGQESEVLEPVLVDLRKHQGKEIYIRIVDEHTGHWGHVNFDDFRFHAEAIALPKRQAEAPPIDTVKNAGLKPEDAVKAIAVPADFSVSLFAGEPKVSQPVAFCVDGRGRLWVAEAHSYPQRQPEGKGKDKILIFEDTDGDGIADKSTVFAEGLNLVSGLEVGFGGVWVGAAPYLMFIADKNGDDKADGAPQILLDGFAYQDTHETLNAFNWGPDGWLYGCHGVFTHSNVGKPGAADAQRTKINAGVWRYHPTKHAFEVFAEGTSNPWGVDFNDYGQAFISSCVIPHLYHIIQGARYERQAGRHFSPFAYTEIKTIADHRHWAGAGGPHAGNNRSDAAGGGHAHCGAMIYLGDSFPASYRNTIFMANIHGNRLNNDILDRKGSGYVGKHGADFLLMNDKWSRIINMKYGPDGSVYLIDWYDQQACHLGDPTKFDRSNGRIYKVTHKSAKPVTGVNIASLPDSELVKLQTHNNDWYVRQARRVLQERNPGAPAHAALTALLAETADPAKHLRALWSLHVTGGMTDPIVLGEMKNPNEYVRAWAIQLAAEGGAVSDPVLGEFVRLAAQDPSPVVRLYLASALQRMPLEQRPDVLKGLLAHAEDKDDHNLPTLLWYAVEPLAGKDPSGAFKLVSTTQIPGIRQFMAKRIAAGGKAQ